MNVLALILSFALPFVGGTWLFLRSGHSAIFAVSRGLWITLYAVIPVMAFTILAAGTKQLTGFNIFPAVPVVVLLFFAWVSGLRSPTPRQGQEAEVVTYKSGAYCQLKLPSGERVLISCAQNGIKIIKLALGGLIPTQTIVKWPISQLTSAFELFADETAPTQHPLDAIKNKLLTCLSIAEIQELYASSEADLPDAQELVNKYGAVLEHSTSITASEAILPAPKGQIKVALLAIARHAKASGASIESLEPLKIGYASLADFVSEEDAKAASNFDNLVKSGAQTEVDDARLREIVRNMADLNTPDVYRRSADEFARLSAEFDDRLRQQDAQPIIPPDAAR